MSDGPPYHENETHCLLPNVLKVFNHFTYLLFVKQWCCKSSWLWIDSCSAGNSSQVKNGSQRVEGSHFNCPVYPNQLSLPTLWKGLSHHGFLGTDRASPNKTFIRSGTAKPMTLTNLQAPSTLNVENLRKLRNELHPSLPNSLTRHRQEVRAGHQDIVSLLLRENMYWWPAPALFLAKSTFLRWSGLRRATKANSDYIFQVKELLNAQFDDLHLPQLILFRDTSNYYAANMSHCYSQRQAWSFHSSLVLKKPGAASFHSLLKRSGDTKRLARPHCSCPQRRYRALWEDKSPQTCSICPCC